MAKVPKKFSTVDYLELIFSPPTVSLTKRYFYIPDSMLKNDDSVSVHLAL